MVKCTYLLLSYSLHCTVYSIVGDYSGKVGNVPAGSPRMNPILL